MLNETYHKEPLPKDITTTVSIITPSFNQGDFLEKTIKSVLSQSYPKIEYVVQDGGSTDNSLEIIKKHQDRLHYWESGPDGGQAAAINRGFQKTSGEIMAWLNSDDMIAPGTINYVVNFFNNNPNVDMVYGHRHLIDEFDREIGLWVLPKHSDMVLKWADYIPQETAFWRRRVWDRVGGINEDFKFALDWDLFLRFVDAGSVLLRLPRFMGLFRVYSDQKTQAMCNQGKLEMEMIRKRALGYIPNNNTIMKNIKPYLNRHLLLHYGYSLGIIKK